MKITKTYTLDLDVVRKWEKKILSGQRSKSIEGYMKKECKK